MRIQLVFFSQLNKLKNAGEKVNNEDKLNI